MQRMAAEKVKWDVANERCQRSIGTPERDASLPAFHEKL
jgi:hypothetical protein